MAAERAEQAEQNDIFLTQDERAVVAEVLKALRGLAYGYVQIIVQDSKVVQIDRTEKNRLTSSRQA